MIINRTNIDKALGTIEEQYLSEDRGEVVEKGEKVSNRSPTKTSCFTIDDKELKSVQTMELMSYEKLREYAKDYISIKKWLNLILFSSHS